MGEREEYDFLQCITMPRDQLSGENVSRDSITSMDHSRWKHWKEESIRYQKQYEINKKEQNQKEQQWIDDRIKEVKGFEDKISTIETEKKKLSIIIKQYETDGSRSENDSTWKNAFEEEQMKCKTYLEERDTHIAKCEERSKLC